MATAQGITGSNIEVAILTRVIRPEKDDLPLEQAKALLRLKFEQSDLDRLHDLVVATRTTRCRLPRRTSSKVTSASVLMVDLMHAKARYSLRPQEHA